MLPSKAGLNFHPQYFHIAIKGGLYNDVAGCSASIHCLHEHSCLHDLFIVTSALVRNNCFGRCFLYCF